MHIIYIIYLLFPDVSASFWIYICLWSIVQVIIVKQIPIWYCQHSRNFMSMERRLHNNTIILDYAP